MIKFICTVIIVLICSPVFSEKMRIAVMDFEANGISEATAQSVSELIRGNMINTGKYIVTERTQMRQILDEQGFQRTGCSDVNCAVEIGKILSANKILVGTVIDMQGAIIITGRIVDVESGVGEFSEDIKVDSEKELYDAVKNFTKKLTERIFDDDVSIDSEVVVQPEELEPTPVVKPSGGMMRIAIMDLKANGIQEVTAKTVSNMLRSEIIKMDRFTVVERSQMNEIFKEQGFQQAACTEDSCAVELGKLLAARKMLLGEVSPIGKSIVITIRIVDVERGVSEFAGSQKAESEDVLDVTVKKAARELACEMEGGDCGEGAQDFFASRISTLYTSAPTGYYLRSLVPGWGQLYAGDKKKAIIYGSAFGGAVLLTAITYWNYTSTKDEYDALKSGPRSDYDDAYDSYESATFYGNIAFALLGASYIANWVDVLLFTKSSFRKRASLSFNDNRQYRSGDYYASFSFTAPGRKPEQGMNMSLNLKY